MDAIAALRQVISQIQPLLHQIPAAEYRQPRLEFEGSSLGQHFRHILEFFQCLAESRDSGMVDYAARRRNLLYEDSPALASEAFDIFENQLEDFDCQQLVQVRAEFGSTFRPAFQSTVGRELLFVYDHAIHHLALIKIGLICHLPELADDRNLGVSPSTLKHRQAVAS